jgi:FKBP-type peptidyl-prolyl cis-trans isomerase 2
MKKAAHGDTVTVHYIGTLDSGRIFQRTDEGEPLVFTIGAGQVFPALEREIVGMGEGEARNIVLAAEDAYGPRRPENIITVARSMFPVDREITVGAVLRVEFGGGTERVMRVAAVTETEVTLDGNHALAGQELTFALRLEKVGE